MKNKVKEEVFIFASIVKWVILATIAGMVVGMATTAFLNLLNSGSAAVRQSEYFFLLLPFSLFASAAAIKYLAPDAEGHGTEKVIEAVNRNSGKISWRVVPVKLLSTIITIACGGSAGKEGPAAQIGGGLMSWFADLFRFDEQDHKKLVICGISAGFAAIFGTPIAGAIFGVEVLVVGGLLYDVLLPSFIAGIVSYHTASALGVLYLKHNIGFVPVFSSTFFIEVIVSGIFFGLCSLILIEALNYGRNLSRRLALWQPLKGFLGGVILIFLTLIFSTRYLGLGTDIIEDALNGRGVLWYDFLLKTVYTSITLNFGGSGGIITPTFYLGATSGALFADVFNLDIATFASIGFVSLLAGAANTPIAASIMATELFGPEIAPYAAIACIVSFLISGHRSVYPSQFLAMKKSASIDVEIGGEIEDARPKTRVRSKKLKKAINAARNVGKKDI